MLRSLFLIFLSLQAALMSSALELGSACGVPGAVECDPASRRLLGCTAGGRWAPLRECGGGCGAGRCAGAGAEAPALAPRADPACDGHTGQMVCKGGCGGALGFCTAQGDWLETEQCGPGQTCTAGKCASNSTCLGNQATRCLKDGSYPDLYSCNRYYTCRTTGSVSAYTCSEGLLYDACYQSCRVRQHDVTDECAWQRVRACQPGEVGHAPNNDRIYYLCSNDTITWNECPYGHWDALQRRCVDEHVPGCGKLAQPAPQCKEPGPEAVPGTDCSFFYCYQNGTYTVVDCPDGYHFDKGTGACVQGKCT